MSDQTQAELDRTRKVVAAAMAEQIATNQAAAEAGVTPAADAPEAWGLLEVPKGNASRDEWASYAAARGHDIDDEWGRDDIRDLFAEEN